MKDIFLEKGEAFIIFDKIGRDYFSNLEIEDGVLLMAERKIYFTDARIFNAVKNKLKRKNIEPYLYSDFNDIGKVLSDLKIERVYIDFETTSVKKFNDLKEFGVEVLDGSMQIKKAIARKSELEIKLIKKACQITFKAYKFIIKELKFGVSELEIKKRLEEKMLSLGAEGVAFDTIVAFGKNSAVPHHVSDKTTLKDGDVVLIDMGAKYKGYVADLTRTVFVGKPSKEFKKNYNAVLTANKKAISIIKAGMLLRDADNIARQHLKTENLDRYFTHSLGHGLGREVHEYPYLSPKRDETIENGNVFTIEPGVYFENKYGIRIEDSVVLDGEVKRLFTDDKKLKIIKI